MAASDDRAQWAFLKLLKSSETGKDQSSVAKDSEKETDNLNLPSCLSQILGIRRQANNEVKIPCLICGKLFQSPASILEHSQFHLSEAKVRRLNCLIYIDNCRGADR